MRKVLFVIGALLVVSQAACGASDDAPNDAAVTNDGNTNVDAGDAGTLGPLEVSFEPAVAAAGLPRGVLTPGEGDELFAVYNGVVEYSTDRGRTWEARAAASALSMSFHGGTLFASDGSHLWRSTNKAMSFETLTLPTAPLALGTFMVCNTSDGALWLLSTRTPQLFRSSNDGDAFTAVSLPSAYTAAKMWVSDDGELYLLGDETVLSRTTDGSEWDALGTYQAVYAVWAAASSELMYLSGRADDHYVELRSTNHGDTWDTTTVSGAYYYFENEGVLTRVAGNLLVDVSDNDGDTWTPRVTATTTFFVTDIVDIDDELIGVSTESLARLSPAATEWTLDEALGLPHAAVARFADIAFSTTGRVVVIGDDQLFVSDNQGVTFRRGRELDTDIEVGTFHSVAIRPDGERIFVGGTNSRYAIFEGDAETMVYQNAIPGRTAETLNQAQWTLTGGSDVLFVTTANDTNTSGLVFQSSPEDDRITWSNINPLILVDAPTEIAGAGYYGFAYLQLDSTVGVMMVGVRRNWGASGIADMLYENLDHGNTNEWRNVDRPVAGYPMTISAVNEYGDSTAFLYPNNQLFIGGFTNLVQHVPLGNTLGNVIAAKFAPDGKLWLVTDIGLFRSTTVFE